MNEDDLARQRQAQRTPHNHEVDEYWLTHLSGTMIHGVLQHASIEALCVERISARFPCGAQRIYRAG